jgi:hypothetical protein
MTIEMNRGEEQPVDRARERCRWPERAYDNEQTLLFARPRRVLVDRVAREEGAAAAPEGIRENLAIDDPFGC